MDIVVCVKWVPFTSGAALIIEEEETRINKKNLTYTMNEWDVYALEEAIRIRDRQGGRVVVITIAPPEADAILRRCLAMGADKAVHIWDDSLQEADSHRIAKILQKAISELPHDLIVTGAQADDDGCALVGGLLAAMIGIPSASLVKKVIVNEDEITVHREIEGGIEEIQTMRTPALITVQTGINEPRYVTMKNIIKARKIKIDILNLSALHGDGDETGPNAGKVQRKRLFVPPETKGATILPGDAGQAVAELVAILTEQERVL